MTKILGVIPARFGSTRFPGKPLADIGGKSMIQRVYEQVAKCKGITHVLVATDNTTISEHVYQFGGDACLTMETHPTGTDRCYEALTLQKEKYDYLINIQGDEPFIQPDQIELLISLLDGQTEIATLIKKIEIEDELYSAGEVKVVKNKHDEALYFSRAVIPRLSQIPKNEWFRKFSFYKHIGLYAFRGDILKELSQLPVSVLEKAESLEQLRWLENGFRIKLAETTTESMCIETPDDIDRAVAYLKNLK